MHKLFIGLFVLTCYGCFPDFEPNYCERNITSSVQFENAKFELYSYSAAFAESPSYVVLKTNLLDTICVTTNVVTIEKDTAEQNSIIIKFSGSPRMYSKKISIAKRLKGFRIRIVTTSKY